MSAHTQVYVYSEFEDRMYKEFAVNFVDVYVRDGEKAAALYALEAIARENIPKAECFVTEEFLRRGYSFEKQ